MTKSTEIYVLDKRLKLLQIDGGFRTSMDSVFLGASCRARTGDHILDLGCGVGSAGLCVLKRVPGVNLTGVDIQTDHIDLARQNAAENDLQDQVDFIVQDIRDFTQDNTYDHVICNPPYLEAGTHLVSPSASKAKALGHEDDDLDIEIWLDRGFRTLKQGGGLHMIHRADMIDKIIRGLKNRFGQTEIIPLWPRSGEAAKRVIVRTVKGRKSPAILHPGIVLHHEDGAYTQDAQNILREMGAID